MNPGAVILSNVQQADGQLKPRPMIVLQIMPPFSDLLVVALSSQLRHEVENFDEVIDEDSDDYTPSGLKVPSLIRLGLLSTIPRSDYIGRLGNISENRLSSLRNRLAGHIES